MAKEPLQLPHKLILDERKKLTLTGVTEVISFDSTAVTVHTSLGMLEIQGNDLKLKTLLPEGGQIQVEGEVSSVEYTQPRVGGWHRLFG